MLMGGGGDGGGGGTKASFARKKGASEASTRLKWAYNQNVKMMPPIPPPPPPPPLSGENCPAGAVIPAPFP